MREYRTSGSVGALGGRPPGATRPVLRFLRPPSLKIVTWDGRCGVGPINSSFPVVADSAGPSNFFLTRPGYPWYPGVRAAQVGSPGYQTPTREEVRA